MLLSAVVKDTGRTPPCQKMFVSDATSGGSGHHCGGLWHLLGEHVLTLSLSHTYKDTQNPCILTRGIFYNVVIRYS